MSEKTEQPTQKRIRDARQKGQVAKSVEISSGVQLAVLLGYFYFQGPALEQSLQSLVEVTIQVVNQDIAHAMNQIIIVFLDILLQYMGGIALLVIASTILAIQAQIGPLLALESMKPSLDKINPLANLKQLVSMKSLFEFAKSVFKVLVLSMVFIYLIRQYASSLQFLPLCGARCGIDVTSLLLFWMWAVLVGFYVVFGIADFAFQRRTIMKQLMMSKEDIKQEFKDSEGNPEIKHKRKEAHREVQSGSLAKNVAKSSVVVRNPTHLAICLYYQNGETPLPQVLEKGEDALALHIVRLAEKSGVPVVEHVPVARALMAEVEVGEYIPSSLFEPVAHILRMVLELDYEQDETQEDL
jgi:type III secretion protein U